MYQVDLGEIKRPGKIRRLSFRAKSLDLLMNLLLSKFVPSVIARSRRVHTLLLRYLLRPPIFVLSPKKTGSWSIAYGLVRSHNGLVFQQNSRFGWSRLDDGEDADDDTRFVFKVNWHGGTYRKHPRSPAIVIDAERIWHKFPIRVISLVREPIQRDISEFFQLAYMEHGISGVHRSDLNKVSPEQLRNAFLEAYLQNDVLDSWYKHNLEDLFGINVYAIPFPKEKGFQTYHKGRVSLLLIKTALPDELKMEAVRGFIGDKWFKMRKYNETDAKVYGDHYREFKRAIKLPREYVEKRCSSTYTRHFFEPAEIAAMRSGH